MIETLKNLHKTFYAAPFYHALVNSWKGFGLSFLLVVTVVTTAHLSFVIAEPYRVFAQEEEAFFTALPAFDIADGKITSDNAEPLTLSILKEYKEGPITIVIDTKNDATFPDQTRERMKKDKITLLVSGNGLNIYSAVEDRLDFSPAKEMRPQSISKEDWAQVRTLFNAAYLPSAILFVFVITLFAHLITALIGAFFLMLIGPLFKARLAFDQAFRLTAAAKVPVAAVFLVIQPQPVAQTLVWFGFAIFGLLSAQKLAKTTE